MSSITNDGTAVNGSSRELRRTTIKEELVALTGDFIDAAVLNYFIKCQSRARTIEAYILEERARRQKEGLPLGMELTGGWFYKKAEQASEETMLGLSKSNMRARIAKLIVRGWIHERQNPNIRWDKTKQYRVDIAKIDNELRVLGYALDGWLIERIGSVEPRSSKTEHGSSNSEHREDEIEPGSSKTEPRSNQNETALPSTGTGRDAGQGNNGQGFFTQQQCTDAETWGTDPFLDESNETQTSDVVALKNNSLSRSNTQNSEEIAQLATALESLRVTVERSHYLAKRFYERARLCADYWKANPEELAKKNKPGAAVASSIESPEKWPQIAAWRATPEPVASSTRKAAAPDPKIEEMAMKVFNEQPLSYQEAVKRDGHDIVKYVQVYLVNELAAAMRSQK